MEEKSLKFVKMADNQPKGSDSKKLLFIHDLENSVDFPYKPFSIKGLWPHRAKIWKKVQFRKTALFASKTKIKSSYRNTQISNIEIRNYMIFPPISRALWEKKERGVEKTQIESSYDKFSKSTRTHYYKQ